MWHGQRASVGGRLADAAHNRAEALPRTLVNASTRRPSGWATGPILPRGSLASGRTHLVSLWTYHPYQAVAVQVMEHLDQQAHDHGYGLLVSDVATHEGASFQPAFSPVASDGLLALDCGPFADMIAPSVLRRKRPW